MNPFDTIEVASSEALQTFDKLYETFPQTGKYPFLIGNDDDLRSLRAMIELPADGGIACIAHAEALDVQAWFAAQGVKKPRSLAKGMEPQRGWVTLTDLLTGKPKPVVHIGLIELDQPWHLFARLGFGNWNDCPEPHVHVALHKYWQAQFGVLPVAVSGDVIECFVPRPPVDTPALLQLAAEQYAYCHDIVEQGVGSKPKLAASLLGARIWYFWWD